MSCHLLQTVETYEILCRNTKVPGQHLPRIHNVRLIEVVSLYFRLNMNDGVVLGIRSLRIRSRGQFVLVAFVTRAYCLVFDCPFKIFKSLTILPRTALTKDGLDSVPNSFASSIASSITTLGGVSR